MLPPRNLESHSCRAAQLRTGSPPIQMARWCLWGVEHPHPHPKTHTRPCSPFLLSSCGFFFFFGCYFVKNKRKGSETAPRYYVTVIYSLKPPIGDEPPRRHLWGRLAIRALYVELENLPAHLLCLSFLIWTILLGKKKSIVLQVENLKNYKEWNHPHSPTHILLSSHIFTQLNRLAYTIKYDTFLNNILSLL